MEKILRKITANAEYEMSQLKHLFLDRTTVGFFGSVFAKSGVPKDQPLKQEYFDAAYEGICNELCGGCEYEFETEESYKDYLMYFNANNYQYVLQGFLIDRWGNRIKTYPRSPYRNLDIPFLVFNSDV